MALEGIDTTTSNTIIFIYVGGTLFITTMTIYLFFSLRKINSDFYLLKKGFILVPF
jgi:hypothetical protein